MSHNARLCLNLNEVRKKMRLRELSKKDLGLMIGMKDPHTIAFYFLHPDKIRLSHITAIAEALGSSPYQYDEFVARVSTEEEFNKLVRGEVEPW